MLANFIEYENTGKYLFIGIDVGVTNLGICFALVHKDFTTVEVHAAKCVNINILAHNTIPKSECKLSHTKSGTDKVDHFIQNFKDLFEKSAHIAMERQPQTVFPCVLVVQELLLSAFKHKVNLVQPVSMHKFHGLTGDYESRKKQTEEICTKYMTESCLAEFKSIFLTRSHDIADSICLLTFRVAQLRKEYLRNIEKEIKERAFKKLNGTGTFAYFNKFLYEPKNVNNDHQSPIKVGVHDKISKVVVPKRRNKKIIPSKYFIDE